MTLKRKVALQASVASAALLLMAGIGWFAISSIQADVDIVSEQGVKPLLEDDIATILQYQNGIAKMLNADRDAYQAFVAERTAMTDRAADAHQQVAADNDENAQQVKDRMAAAAEALGPVTAETYVQFQAALDQWMQATARTVDLCGKAETHAQGVALHDSQSKPAFDKMRHLIDVMTEQAEAAIADRQKASEQKVAVTTGTLDGVRAMGNRMLTAFGTVAVISAVGFMLFGGYMYRSIGRAFGRLISAMEDIAQGEGDLTKRVEINSKDEIGELAQWFNTFVAKVHDIIAEVAGVTREVASAATQIAASSEEMAQGMTQQNQQTTQVSSAVEEMSSTVVEVARKSTDAAGTADEAGKRAADGGHVVERTVTSIKTIADTAGSTAAALGKLGERSQQIGQIIAVINDIADQTNLLALNAAIEAARAGEHGRGFAVVADEVRKLAERTTTATEEVADSIKAIQSETQDAVEHMNTGSERVTEGVQLAEEAGESLKAIVEGSNKVATMIQSIAAAAEQQSAASEEIARNVENINAVTRQSAEGANQAATAATQLSEKAETLQQLISQFKLAGRNEA